MKFSLAILTALATAASAQYNQQPAYAPQPPVYAQQPQYGMTPGGYQQPQQYGQYQGSNKYSPAEAGAWHHCVDLLLDNINMGHQGTKLACSVWTCLENTASQYGRGGALAALGGVVNPVCKLSGIVPDFI